MIVFFDTFASHFWNDLGGVGVAIFLFLSGFGVYESAKLKGVDSFISNKIKKIVLPFLVIFALYRLVSFQVFGARLTDPSFWYIPYLLFWYLVFYIFWRFGLRAKKIVWSLFLASLLVVIFQLSDHGIVNLISFPAGVAASVYYLNLEEFWRKTQETKTKKFIFMGMLLILALIARILVDFVVQTTVSKLILGLIFIILSEVYSYIMSAPSKINYLVWLILPFALNLIFGPKTTYYLEYSSFYLLMTIFIVFTLQLINQKYSSFSKIFFFLGTISFELYFLHGTFMYTYDFILFRGPLELTFLIYLLGIVTISYCYWRLFNRSKIKSITSGL